MSGVSPDQIEQASRASRELCDAPARELRDGRQPAFRRRRPAAAPTGRTRRPVRTTVPVASPAAGPHPVRPPRPRRPDANAWSPRRCRHPGRSPPSRWSTRPGRCSGAPARRYNDLAVLTTATVGFALGVDTGEGTKQLRRADAGAAVGLGVAPQLATLRARLSALADGSDPLALQRAFAAGMLAADPAPDPVYFVDDHFVAYSGARPVAKGWNTKRRHAQPGRDDTLLVDARGRAVVFGTGEPTALVSTLPGVLTQLRHVLGPDLPIMLGFDRGGAYPGAFTACRDAGADWVTYRRAPLVEATVAPRRS